MKKALKIFLWSHVILILIGVFLVIYTFILIPKKAYEEALDAATYDVIIVPGLPFEDGKWSDLMQARVAWSWHLYNMGLTKNVIYSGSAVYTPYYEGKIMAMYGAGLGIPKENIFSEIEAEHSTENLVYSYRLAKEQGFERIALATDPFQSAMLSFYSGDFEEPVDRIPILFPTLKELDYKTEIDIDSESAKAENFVALPERETQWERFQGTLGKGIKDE